VTSFLDLPARSEKPREQGITHVLDRGLSVAEAEGMIEVAGRFVDFVKLGWGTALATGNLEAKLERYRAHDIPVVLGGTLTEIALARRTARPVALLGSWDLRAPGADAAEDTELHRAGSPDQAVAWVCARAGIGG